MVSRCVNVCVSCITPAAGVSIDPFEPVLGTVAADISLNV
jgi:hypothetical protein